MKRRNSIRFLTLILLGCFLLAACDKVPTPTTGTEPPRQTTAGQETPKNTDPTQQSTHPTQQSTAPTQETEAPTDPTEPPVDPRVPVCQYVPAEVTAPEGIPVLKWVCLRDEWTHTWSEDAAIELNQMLAERNMPFRVQFVMVTFRVDDIYAPPPTSAYVDWFSKPEIRELLQDADLIYGAMSGQEMREYLVPITENVSGGATPSLENAVPHRLNWLTQTIDGEIYGIPSGPSQGTTTGWFIDSAFYQKAELTEADLTRNFWEMDALFARLYQQNGNQPFLKVYENSVGGIVEIDETVLPRKLPEAMGDFVQGNYTCIGACFGIDTSSGTPKVVNLMGTDAVRLYQEAILRYKRAGYLTDDEKQVQITYSSGLADFPYTAYRSGDLYFPVTEPVVSSSRPGGYTIGVAASSRNPDMGTALLSLIAEDEAFRMQLLFGKEGRDYTAKNNAYRVVSREDGSSYSMRFLSPLSYFSGFASEGAIYAEEGKTELESFREVLDRSTLFYPIVFDYSGLQKELAAVQKVIDLYFPNIVTTKEIRDDPTTKEKDPVPVMDKAGYDKMIQAFRDAGSDKIVAELQSQLDSWLADHPE